MRLRPIEQGLVAVAVIYLVCLSWAMGSLSFDIWGAMVTGPVLLIAGIFLVRRVFRGDLEPLQRIMILGVVVKLAGAGVRYGVAFGAYGGATDAERYHNFARQAAGAVWTGTADLSTVLPSGTGTTFMERLTAFIYTVLGSSKLSAYFVFAWLGYIGLMWFVRAACLAIPGLERRRYAALCVLAPSVVYWPASIGKEAWMLFTLGIATYGIARLLVGGAFFRGLVVTALGLGGATLMRPHMAGVWVAALVPALLVAVFRRRDRASRDGFVAQRVGLVIAIGVVMVALSAIASATVKYLNPGTEESTVDSQSITDILNETTRRTSEAGSTFTPPTITGAKDWPFASLRTLTRPLLIEVNGFAQLVSAVEILLFLLLCLFAYRRVLHLPKLVVTNPFLAFAMTGLFLGGLAYASFANLGVLARQKSLLFPLMLLIPCVPRLRDRGMRNAVAGRQHAESATVEAHRVP